MKTHIGTYDVELDSNEIVIHTSYNNARKEYDEEIVLNICELREILHKMELCAMRDFLFNKGSE